MMLSIRLIAPLAALVAFSADAADITGDWTATIVTAAGQRDYTYVFRQTGAKLIGTVTSQDGVVAITNGSVNNKTITFDENVTLEGRRAVLEYTGELVSETEIEFKRQVKGAPYLVIQFVARRGGTP
jgi:hypothetical protein